MKVHPVLGYAALLLVFILGQPATRLTAQSAPAHGLTLFQLTPVGTPPWRLALAGAPGRRPTLSEIDPAFTRLVLSGLEVRWLPKEPWERLLSEVDPELKPQTTQWVLLDSASKAKASGAGLPGVAGLEGTLRNELGTLPWDGLEAVLRAEPRHGEARLALAEWALAWAAPASFRSIETRLTWQSQVSINAHAAADEALGKLLAVPDWPSQVALNEAGAGGRLGRLLRRGAEPPRLEAMSEQVLEALRGDPANGRLQGNLAFFLDCLEADQAERLLGESESVEPLPGQVWPPLPIIHAGVALLRRQNRWPEIRQRMAAWSKPADPLFLTSAGWGRHVLREATLKAYDLQAESWLEGWDRLPDALDTLRGRAGGDYLELARLLLAKANLPREDTEFMKTIAGLVARQALSAPPMPSPTPPWRIRVRSPAELARLREAFDTRMVLVPWLPSERLLEPAPHLEEPIALFLNKEVQEAEPGLLVPESLADQLRTHRAGRLFMAWERASREPDSPGPRDQRIALSLERMPVRALESMLAQDLSKAGRSVDLLDWGVDENLWFVQSRQAMPECEERLRHWPLDNSRWAALAFWTSFLPNHPGPLALARELPSWQAGLSLQLCLTAQVHGQLAEEFQRRRAWRQMRAWFEAAWNDLRDLDPKDLRRKALLEGLGSTLKSGLDRCYAELARPGERKLLQEEWERLRPGRSP